MTNKQAAIEIIEKLRKAGFTAFLAGGCVRDMLLARAAKDYDVATDAAPQQIIKLFKRTLKVGAKFGVVIVLIDAQQVEVATFRTESGYQDGRHPESVEFSNPKEDALRRDFTINGMFCDPANNEIIDYVGGQADLKKKIIRTIGSPQQRFGEDYLRMLRAVRFAAQLDFKIAADTFAAIKRYAPNITRISSERIALELEAILTCPNRVSGVKNLAKSGLLAAIFEAMTAESVEDGIAVLVFLPEDVDFALALAAFFAGCQTDFACEMGLSLKLSNKCLKHLRFLLENRGSLLNAKMSLAQLKLLLAEPYFEDLFILQKAICKAQSQTTGPLTALRKRINALGDVELKPASLLNGHDIMRLGGVSGPALGHLAKEMYIAQLEGEIVNKEQAEQWVKKWLPKHKDFV